jgi:hypothetical protein
MPDSAAEPDDFTLLKQYAEGDESAFSALVQRYVNLVYSASLRQVCNPSHAEEITQAVFIILTQKAPSLSPKTILPAGFTKRRDSPPPTFCGRKPAANSANRRLICNPP